VQVELLEQLYDYEKQDGWVERLLLAAPVRKIRQAAANDMLRLSQQVESEALQKLGAEPPAKHFLEALLSILPGITSYSATCQQVPLDPLELTASLSLLFSFVFFFVSRVEWADGSGGTSTSRCCAAY
jgi:hypothetical protein